jgi:hypothetical protein
MVYRIRHHADGQADDRTTRVEANSPTEALVKFQATRDRIAAAKAEIVTSVCAEESGFVLQW